MFREGTCPKCGKQIQVPDDQEKILCMYCGEEILVSRALGEKDEKDPVLYEESRQKSLDGIRAVIQSCQNPMQEFKRDLYPGVFEQWYAGYRSTFEAMEYVYQHADHPAGWAKELAEALVEEAKADLESLKGKGKKNQRLLDLNFQVSVYLIPAALKYPSEVADPFAEAVIALWNREFETTIGKATFEIINGGFRRKLCYITTAVCESLGKEQDCYELRLLKSYRDQYLEKTPEGHALVEEYYDLAPTIVKRIERQPDRKELYQELYQEYLLPCIRSIEAGDPEACRETYQEMVLKLKDRYMNEIPRTERRKQHG